MIEAVLWFSKTKPVVVIASCRDNPSKDERHAFHSSCQVGVILAHRATSERIEKEEQEYLKKNGEPKSKRSIAAFDKFQRALFDEYTPQTKYRHTASPSILGDSYRWCRECLSGFVHDGTMGRMYCSDACRRKSSCKATREASKTIACQQCGESFATSRSDAKYCSARCRVAFSRS